MFQFCFGRPPSENRPPEHPRLRRHVRPRGPLHPRTRARVPDGRAGAAAPAPGAAPARGRGASAAGLSTPGLISGYRGSPLGTYDIALWGAREQLEGHHIRFEPGVNEDLAATAVWGTQQANLHPGPRYDGVFAIWYGKGPGVDRSCDAIKHGNYAGTAPRGGVLALCGDDPGAKSSSIAHQDRKSVG